MSNSRNPVGPEEWLYRTAYRTPEKNYMNPDGSVSSRAFKLREKDHGELSVYVKSMTTPEIAIKDKSRFALVELKNQGVLELDLYSYYDPVEGNPAHAVIIGMTMEDEVTPGLLARRARIVNI